MLIDITPISKIDWESKGERAYSVPFTSIFPIRPSIGALKDFSRCFTR